MALSTNGINGIPNKRKEKRRGIEKCAKRIKIRKEFKCFFATFIYENNISLFNQGRYL